MSYIDPVHFALAQVALALMAGVSAVVFASMGTRSLASQQHRSTTAAFHTAPIVLGLITSCTYLGVTTAGVLGAVAIRTLDAHDRRAVAIQAAQTQQGRRIPGEIAMLRTIGAP